MAAPEDPSRPAPGAASRDLAEQLRRRIEAGQIRPGARLGSLREVAGRLGLTRHTVLAAYRSLEGTGLVEARHGSGFYAAAVPRPGPPGAAPGLDALLDTALLIRGFLEPGGLLRCGSGSLPREWLQELGLHRHVRAVAAQPNANLYEYGSRLGYLPLREALQHRLARRRIVCDPDQLVLTAGVTQGIELVIRGLCRPGDTVLVEHPGYYNLFGLLHLSGLNLLAVPRRSDGPDLDVLEAMLRAGTAPKVFFMQTLLHNPTGTSMDPAGVHRLLLLAEQHDFAIVENDAYADLAEDTDLRLAALALDPRERQRSRGDGWSRVIYLSGFTKTLSAGLRVGFLAAVGPTVERLDRAKLVTSIATSEFLERVVYRVLLEGRYDRFTTGLRNRLRAAQESWQADLDQAGWQVFPGARRGMFIWARHPRWPDSMPLARDAASAGFWLAPGGAFDPERAPSPWVRFNVAYRTPALSAWLRKGL